MMCSPKHVANYVLMIIYMFCLTEYLTLSYYTIMLCTILLRHSVTLTIKHYRYT